MKRFFSALALGTFLVLLNVGMDGFARGWYRRIGCTPLDGPEPNYLELQIENLGEAFGEGLAHSPVAAAFLVVVVLHAVLSLAAPDFAHRCARRGHAIFADTWALCRASLPALLVVGVVVGGLAVRFVVVGACVVRSVPWIF